MASKKKNIVIVLALILFVIVIAGATYAFVFLNINVTNAAYSGVTGCFDIDYSINNDDGTLPITGTLFQSSTPKGGLSGKVTLSINSSCNVEGSGTINLNVSDASDSVLFQTVDAHCESSKTLSTLPQYTTSNACNAQSGAIWVDSGSALKYAIYEDVTKEPVSVGYINQTGLIAAYENFQLAHSPKDYYIYIWLDGELADNSYANASFVGYSSAIVRQVSSWANVPELDAGMIPVTIADNGTVTTISSDDSDWYNYENKKWANVVLVNESATTGVEKSRSRADYLSNLSNKVEVAQEDILAYYTWIPRYKYRIWTDVNTSSSPQTIDIVFESATASMSNGTQVGQYMTHPAFWWDNDSDSVVDTGEMIAGIWVGKFETTPDKSSTCYTSQSATNCDNSTQNPTILPNLSSLRYQKVSNQFGTSQKFSAGGNIYGLSSTTIDAHMMKNSEWGSVAYLSHSAYGINEEIIFNNNSNYVTGCGALSENATYTTFCEISYNSSSTPQSTTGNITGVFDMSGGAWERVMGNYGNLAASSGFTSLPETKYYDFYDDVCTLNNCGGHALYETASWYSDEARYGSGSGELWLHRGGTAGIDPSTGIFAAHFGDRDLEAGTDTGLGLASGDVSWRSVLVPIGGTGSSEPQTYTVKYYAGSSSLGETTISVDDNLSTWDSLGATVNNSAYGWEFAGWTTLDDNPTEVLYTDGQSVEEIYINDNDDSVELYAVYKRDVTFKSGLNGETTDAVMVQYWNPLEMPSDVNIGGVTSPSVTTPTSYSNYGWSAIGWNSEEFEDAPIYGANSLIYPAVNATNILYGIYSRNITFKSGVYGSNTSSTRVQYLNSYNNTVSSVNSYVPTAITNWTAIGWRSDTTRTSYQYSAITTSSTITLAYNTSSTLNAVYQRRYSISYINNFVGSSSGNSANFGYYNSGHSLNAYVDITVTMMGTTASYNGATFIGWNTSSDGSGTSYSASTTYNIRNTISYNSSTFGMTLYAIYGYPVYIDNATTTTRYIPVNGTLTFEIDAWGLSITSVTGAQYSSTYEDILTSIGTCCVTGITTITLWNPTGEVRIYTELP